MALTTKGITGPFAGTTVTVDWDWMDSVKSPRVNGKLVLQMNPFDRWRGWCLYYKGSGPWQGKFTVLEAKQYLFRRYPKYDSVVARQANELNSKAYGKLHYQGGSLGVSLATWNQSASMVHKRLKGPAKFFGKLVGVLEHVPRKRRFPKGFDPTVGDVAKLLRRSRDARGKKLADDLLEYEFGWKPLFDDLETCFREFTRAIPPEYIRVAARTIVDKTDEVLQNNSYGKSIRTYEGIIRGSYSFECQVENPNLWLANFLGLINLPSIAWDLVPWSFVVNMFVNTGSLINSLTAELGLTITKRSYTIAHKGWVQQYNSDTYFNCSLTQRIFETRNTRVINTQPPRSLQLKLPQGDLELAGIAGALITQQLHKMKGRFHR